MIAGAVVARDEEEAQRREKQKRELAELGAWFDTLRSSVELPIALMPGPAAVCLFPTGPEEVEVWVSRRQLDEMDAGESNLPTREDLDRTWVQVPDSFLQTTSPELLRDARLCMGEWPVLRVTFGPHDWARYFRGELRLDTKRAQMRNSLGRYAAEAHRVEDPPSVVPEALWRLAAALTRQRYLSAIRRDLEALRASIMRIEQWLKDEEQAKLDGSLRELVGIAKALGSGEAPDTDLEQWRRIVEDSAVDCNTVLAQLKIRRKRSLQSPRMTDCSSYKELAQLTATALRIRCLAAYLRVCVGLGAVRSWGIRDEASLEFDELRQWWEAMTARLTVE